MIGLCGDVAAPADDDDVDDDGDDDDDDADDDDDDDDDWAGACYQSGPALAIKVGGPHGYRLPISFVSNVLRSFFCFLRFRTFS